MTPQEFEQHITTFRRMLMCAYGVSVLDITPSQKTALMQKINTKIANTKDAIGTLIIEGA